ncbi:MAG: hypothetical protein ACR2K4_06370 [Candidatus Limnocylindria bacterium]
MSKTPGSLAAATVAVLVVIAVAVLALRAGGAGIAQGPLASVTPSSSPAASAAPTPTESDADPSPSQLDETETLAILAEIEHQVIAIRGLPAAEIGPAQIISRDELGAELQAIFDEEYPPEERERDNRALRAMGLLGPDDDVAELSLELLGDQVLGFYDDVEQRMVVVSDAGLNVEARITYAHEYTHALQDAAFGLDSLETDAAGQDDRGLARTALIEGDATVTMLAWMLQNLSQQEILEYVAGAEIPDTTGIPSWMVAQLAFPYESGLTWTTSLAGGDPTQPEFGEIDAAYDDPPDSTEQVIDIDKWEPREAPDPIGTTDLAAALGDGWEEVESTPIGQATIEIMLSYFGASATDAREAAAGWGGDRAVIASGPDDGFAMAWRLSWDSASDADEFVAAYESVIGTLDFPAQVVQLDGGDVLVAHASSGELLAQTVDAAS